MIFWAKVVVGVLASGGICAASCTPLYLNNTKESFKREEDSATSKEAHSDPYAGVNPYWNGGTAVGSVTFDDYEVEGTESVGSYYLG
ncbi:hypothetical protein MHLP_00780 [Candidatus Mycoplasma haematolamae str. Purdue]|uniref:Lipoprotein n=1 Tax=Mycoplasma haematolamae (strain Purdue) TaxID=1212765 RepID=I7CER1_MYCHA|nr:hypothetical protein [Candidatus Mycoplasma haematolamae]AFO51736.1 hypothetical protein MHLP_00780 [Candidatus Mycoplasma haematolamae str. Purdue]